MTEKIDLYTKLDRIMMNLDEFQGDKEVLKSKIDEAAGYMVELGIISKEQQHDRRTVLLEYNDYMTNGLTKALNHKD